MSNVESHDADGVSFTSRVGVLDFQGRVARALFDDGLRFRVRVLSKSSSGISEGLEEPLGLDIVLARFVSRCHKCLAASAESEHRWQTKYFCPGVGLPPRHLVAEGRCRLRDQVLTADFGCAETLEEVNVLLKVVNPKTELEL